MKITLRIKKVIQTNRGLLLVCCSMFLTSCAHLDKYSFERIGYSNYQFQSGKFTSIKETYEEAAKQKDRNYALWNNQLGSIYLAQGDYDRALDAFLKAYYLMNNIPAFKELESKAVSLTSSEDKKAYKGDPYERSINSLYVGLLLYNKGDLENAMAAFKNGILADSESKGVEYKSDIAVLYLIASRITKKLGDESLSNDYLNAVKELYNNPNYYKLGFNDEFIQRILNLKNNILLVVEFGEGPFKSRRGQYGELAVVCGDKYDTNSLNIIIDGKLDIGSQAYSDTDVYFQASTRGGRKMDGILKGKAQFKTNAANTSVAALDLSNQFINQANQVRAANPYADTSGYAVGALFSALFAGGSAIASAITNPKADIRQWSLLPENIIIFPLFLSPGKHKINIGFIDGRYSRVTDESNYEFEADIQKDKDNIIFRRVLNYQVTANSRILPSKQAIRQGGDAGMDEKLLNALIGKDMSYNTVEQLLGSPTDKTKDSLGREIWFYPSDKAGFSNCVYFTNGHVSELESQPIKFFGEIGEEFKVTQEKLNNNDKSSEMREDRLIKLHSFRASAIKVIIIGFCIVLLSILLKIFLIK